MKNRSVYKIILAAIIALSTAGCNEYMVETKVNEDGSGTRNMVFSMDPNQDELGEMDENGYARMFGIVSDSQWKISTSADKLEVNTTSGKRTFLFESSIDGVEDWSKLDGSISVRGSLEESDYSGIFFSNTVMLETGITTSGRSYTYRESFKWTGLVETVVDFQADAYAKRMKEDFPHLDESSVAELRGIMAGHLLVSVRYLDIWNEGDEDIHKVALSVGKAAEKIVIRAGRKVNTEHIYDVARIYVGDEESVIEPFLEKNLPGVIYAGLTDVKINLVLPGQVLETNGRVQDDGSVEWKMHLMEALGDRVEFFARSEIQ
jgi:hypothetical protein